MRQEKEEERKARKKKKKGKILCIIVVVSICVCVGGERGCVCAHTNFSHLFLPFFIFSRWRSVEGDWREGERKTEIAIEKRD